MTPHLHQILALAVYTLEYIFCVFWGTVRRIEFSSSYMQKLLYVHILISNAYLLKGFIYYSFMH